MSDTVIIRRKVASNYTVLDNTIIRDTRLSWKALGLLVRLLSLPPNFQLRLVTLSKERPSGRDATRSGLKELEQCGYLSIVREREASGKFTTTTWVINDQPEARTRSENPNVGEPIAEHAKAEKPTQVSNDFKQVLSSETTTARVANRTTPCLSLDRDVQTLCIPTNLEVLLPIISHLPLYVQQDIVDEIEGKRRRGALRSNPIGLARHFAANPHTLVLSDGIDVRRDRERAFRDQKIAQLEAQHRKAENEKLAAGLAKMSDTEFNSLCSNLPLKLRIRLEQQRTTTSHQERI